MVHLLQHRWYKSSIKKSRRNYEKSIEENRKNSWYRFCGIAFNWGFSICVCIVYLHAGGFTSGDKADDESMLAWLCSKGYVAAGINYTLRTDTNNASVLLESNEIKVAVPQVIDAAKNQGYPIDKMTVAGGSAGHALAMIYAYRDADEAPVPVVFTFGAVGPSSFYVEDWGIYGFGQDSDESRSAAAGLFGVMAGTEITADEIQDGSYVSKMKEISAAEWVNENPIPTVVASLVFFLGNFINTDRFATI